MTRSTRLKDSAAPFVGTYTRYAAREHGVTTEIGATDVVCYDTETSGTHTRHGQIYQFGCVRADMDLVPRDVYEIGVRRLPYVVPSPGALKVTGLDPTALDDPDRFEEFEASRRIANVLDFPPGVTSRLFLTYNGFKFDDPLISTTLQRNLRHNGYLNSPRTQGREFQDEGTPLTVYRMDMLNVMRLAVALAPDVIAHELHEDGKPNCRLESIAPMNGISYPAHDAVGDAHMTLELARLVRDRLPAVWSIARRASSKGNAMGWVNRFAETGEALYLFRCFGDVEIVPFARLAIHRNRILVVDLRRLAQPLPEGLPETGLKGLSHMKDAYVHVINAGDAPLVMTGQEARPFIDTWDIREHRSLMERLGKGEFDARIGELKARFASDAYQAETDDPTSEEMSFPFPNRDDAAKMRRFRKAEDWSERARIEFELPRLRDYASRLVAMNCDLDALAAELGRTRVDQIRRDSERAFARPFAPAGSRWTVLEEALTDEAADDAYREWAAGAFDPAVTHPGNVPAPEPVERQPSFGF